MRRQDKKLEKKSEWELKWILVQFIVLCVSIPVNIILWVQNSNLEETILQAEYIEKSWQTLGKLEESFDKINEQIYAEIDTLIDSSSGTQQLYDRIRFKENNWREKVLRVMYEAESNLINNKKVLKETSQIDTIMNLAHKRVNRLRSPALITLEKFNAKLVEVEHIWNKISEQVGRSAELADNSYLRGFSTEGPIHDGFVGKADPTEAYSEWLWEERQRYLDNISKGLGVIVSETDSILSENLSTLH